MPGIAWWPGRIKPGKTAEVLQMCYVNINCHFVILISLCYACDVFLCENLFMEAPNTYDQIDHIENFHFHCGNCGVLYCSSPCVVRIILQIADYP